MAKSSTAVIDRLTQFKSGQKGFALLIDPDKGDEDYLEKCVGLAKETDQKMFLIGGSLVFNSVDPVLLYLKKRTNLPLVLFPGSVIQLSKHADAILFLSLISGRNPDYLIGNHVTAAPFLVRQDVEVVPTGYMLVDGGRQTAVEYISQTKPLPNDKPDIAVATALAGEMLGLKVNYMDAGSGAANPVPGSIIKAVSSAAKGPLIVGGGIRDGQTAYNAYEAGASMIVVGNKIEENPSFLHEIQEATQDFNASSKG